MKVKVITLHCKRCNHDWKPRKTEVFICPRCKSPLWNKEKIAKKSTE